MPLAIVHSRAVIGIEAPPVTVEAHLSKGLPSFQIVGLPETAVKESKERVRSAILNCNLEFPFTYHVLINLAPADLPKSGGRFDLAIALGILAATGQVDADKLRDCEFLGELALTGELRAVAGTLPGIVAWRQARRRGLLPAENGAEAGLVRGAKVRLAKHLLEVVDWLRGGRILPVPPRQKWAGENAPACPDLAEVVGQQQARRALTIAAAGAHNLLFRGPPGTGKTLLASRLPGILPPLSDDQALELAAIRSISKRDLKGSHWYQPPFRAPHHSSSAVALVGGGGSLHAGEISLAHHGVLFLDELPEFSPRVLEVLREPLESGQVQISRARYQVSLPARFQLIAAMNPCPCGYFGDPETECRCSEDQVRRYRQRVSGPLLDRIDLHVEVPRLSEAERRALLRETPAADGKGEGGEREARPPPEGSAAIRERVAACRERQLERAAMLNAHLDLRGIRRWCALSEQDAELLEAAVEGLKLSVRAFHRILKIARTIADLEGSERIAQAHLLEAIGYRKFDRQ